MRFDSSPSRGKTGRAGAARSLLAFVACAGLLAACETSVEAPPQVEAPPPISPEVIAVTEQAIDQGRYADAKLLLERVLLAEPGNMRARLGMAEVQLAFGKTAAAAESFEQLVEVPEVAARARQGRGIALLMLGRDREARNSLLQAVESDPGLWRAWNALGSLYDRAGAWKEALAAYDRALEIKPDSAMVYNNRGFSHLLRRDAVATITDFDTALHLDPDLEAAEENLRLAFAWSGNYEQALVGVGRQHIGRAYNNVGFVALLRGDLTTAESYLLRSMAADPTFNKTANKNLEYLRSLKAINKTAEVQG